MKNSIFNYFLAITVSGLVLTSCSNDDNISETTQELTENDFSENSSKANNILIVNNFDIERTSFNTSDLLRVSPNFIGVNGFGSAQIVGFVSNPNRVFIGNVLPQDRIDLSAIDANINTPGNDKFRIVERFSGTPGELIVPDPTRSIGNGAGSPFRLTIKGDVDGDGQEDLRILVTEGSGLADVLTDSLVDQGLIIL